MLLRNEAAGTGTELRIRSIVAAIVLTPTVTACTATTEDPGKLPPEFRDGKPLDLTQFQTLN